MADHDFDERYFGTEADEEQKSKKRTNVLSVGTVALNPLEFELVQMAHREAADAAGYGMTPVGFSTIEEDGTETVIEPGLTDEELGRMNKVYQYYAPYIAAARALGKRIK